MSLIAGLPATSAKADVKLRAEFNNEATTSKRTDKTSNQMKSSDSNRFDQLYNLDIRRHFSPNLSFQAGGIFEFTKNRGKSETMTTINRTDMMHPFLDFNLSTPIYTTGIGYEKTEIRKTGTTQATTRNTQNQLHGRFLWAPVDFPRLNLNYTKNHRFDDRGTNDSKEDNFSLNLRYNWRDLFLNYSYLLDKNKNLITSLESNQESHDALISYSHQLTRNLNLSTSYRGNYGTQTQNSGGSIFLSPISLSGSMGFYLLDDIDPGSWNQTVQTSAGNFLVDGVKSGSSDINLGLSADQTKNVSIGLDFGFATSISTIRLWVDRDATDVANSFNWTIYTSDDNLNWTAVSMARSVTYTGGLDNYFEFALTNSISSPISTRYIKIVTTPLADGPDPTRFNDIFVTELETFSLQQGDNIRRTFDNTGNVGLSWSINPKTSMGYSVFYRTLQATSTNSPIQRNSSLSQTVNLNRIINRTFNASVRGSRDKRSSPSEETLDYSYGTSLVAIWLSTFRQTLTYTGSNSETNYLSDTADTSKEKNKTNALLLRNVANLYRGWSTSIDFGYSWATPWDAGKRYTKIFRFDSSIIPNPKLALNTSFSYSRTNSDQPPAESKQASLSATITPTSAISIFMRLTNIDQNGTSKFYQNYSINWSPFPDGTMQLFLSYDESLNSEGDQTKSSEVGFDWQINRSASLRTSLSKVRSESLTSITDSQRISTILQLSL